METTLPSTTRPALAPVQVAPSHYRWSSYVEQRRWASYWHQIDEVLRVEPNSALVIGPGDGIVVDVLRRFGVQVVTSDIDTALGPNVVADVRDLPFEDGAFDIVLCCQVLEHLPFDQLGRCLAEIARVGHGRAVVSIPKKGRSWEVTLRLAPLVTFQRSGKLPARTRHRFDGQHYWELSARGYPSKRVASVFEEHFRIEREFHVATNPYHHFYVLARRGHATTSPNAASYASMTASQL